MLAALVLLGSCSWGQRDGPTEVSVIGGAFRLADAADGTSSTASDAVLAQATRPGLVRFDAAGQVVPALGESWITTADGLSTIFRLHDLRRPDGTTLSAQEAARRLTAALSSESRNRLKPLLTAVESVVGMTKRVIEVRMRVPRPNLLQLLAQPELGIARMSEGFGRWRVERISTARVRLLAAPLEGATAASETGIDLRTERASLAIARFTQGQSDLVLGGTIADWPMVRQANVRPRRLRFDPARGLLGIAIVGRGAFLAEVRNREALAMAVDRQALAAMLALPGWEVREQLLPEQLDSARAPAQPAWTTIAPAARRVEAARRVAEFARVNGSVPTLTIALPTGPGWRLVLARLIADWGAIGVTLEAVAAGGSADLRAIDAVSPNASANWFLSVTACDAGLVCDARGDSALFASRAAPTLAERALGIAAADDAAAARSSLVVLGAPVRWMLVDPLLTQVRENVFAVHPLDQLRPPR